MEHFTRFDCFTQECFTFHWLLKLGLVVSIPIVFLFIYRGMNFVDNFAFSLSVSDDQAQDILLPPEITQLEDWEIPLPTHQSKLELEALPNNSQVFIYVFS